MISKLLSEKLINPKNMLANFSRESAVHTNAYKFDNTILVFSFAVFVWSDSVLQATLPRMKPLMKIEWSNLRKTEPQEHQCVTRVTYRKCILRILLKKIISLSFYFECDLDIDQR